MTIYSIDDIKLMQMVKDGHREAFAVIVRRHQQSLLNFFRRMGAYNDTEDLIQETFLRLYNYRLQYKPTAKFTTFLYTLARNSWTDWMRKMKRWPVNINMNAISNILTVSHNHTLLTETQIDIQTALNKLSEKLRIAVVMSVYQGLSYQEIADILDIPLGTVKSRIHLAFQELKERLNVKNAT